MFQTDSCEDVIFVHEKCSPESSEINFDQAKRQALQRDIDQESQPKQLDKPLISQRSVAAGKPVERARMKMEEKSDEDFVKKMNKLKKGRISLPENKSCAVNAKSPTEIVKKENKTAKKDDSVVIDLEEESWNGSGKMEEKKKKRKKKNDTESLNDVRGSDSKSENDEEVNKKNRKKQTDSENQVETVPLSIKGEEMEKKERKEKKVKNKSVQIKSASIKIEKEEEEEQQAGKHKLPKKSKKKKNDILAVSTEESKEQVLEKNKKKKKNKTPKEETKVEEDDISVTKKKNKAVTKVSEKQVSLETDAGEVEKVRLKGVKKESKKRLKERRTQKEVETPQIEGKREMDNVEKDHILNKKKGKSTEREIVNTEGGEMELKRKRKKEKGRRATVELSEMEETEPKKKKKRKGNTKGEEEEPLTLKCEEVEEQIKETHLAVSVESSSKKRKKISTKGETQMKNVSFETDAKKKMKEEVEDQHFQESPQVDVVFLSEKSGNIDEVTINQERRQALQMEVDQASKPQKPARLGGFGQWSTAQFNSSDQQQKFLRLMGGFKKGFQQASGSTGRANMALGKDAQQQLQQGLLGEFERAQSRRVDFSNRGAGLGFTTPSNKKFSIDINACRSVRFDD